MIKRIAFLLLPLFLGLSALLFFYRAQIGTSLFIIALEQTGAKEIQLKLTELNSNQMVFSRADCILPDEGGRLSLQNVVLTWDRATLEKKRLHTITIDTLVVDLPQKKIPPGESKLSIEPFISHLERLGRILPFQSLKVHSLIVRGQSAGPLNGRELTLRLDNKKNGITSELILKEQALRLSLDTPDQHLWNITLDQQGQPDPLVTAMVFLKKERVDAALETDLARVHQLYPLFHTALPALQGALSARLSLTRTRVAKADLRLDLQQFAVNDLTADSLHLTLKGQKEAPGKFLLQNNLLKGSGLHYKKNSLASLQVPFEVAVEQKHDQWQFHLTANDKTTIQRIDGANLHIESVQLDPGLSGTFAENKFTLNLKPQWQVKLFGTRSGPVNLAEAILASQQDTQIQGQLNNGYPWNVTPSEWKLTASAIQVRQQELESAPLYFTFEQLAGTGKDWHLKTRLSSDSLEINTSGSTLPLQFISAELKGNTGTLMGTASCVPKTVMGTLAIDFSHDLKQGKGRAKIKTGEPFFFSEMTPLSTIVTPWPLPGDLTGGELQIQSTLNWQAKQPLRLSLQANLSEGKGLIKNVKFSGLSTRQNLQLLPKIQSRKIGEVTINEVNTGITIGNISTKISLNPSPHGKIPVITLQDMAASLFGGTIHDDFLAFDPQQPEIENTITLNNIDLAQTITIKQVRGLAVEGRIHGTIPFRFDKSGLQVKEGTLKNASAGGIIRYTPPQGSNLQGSSLTGYALKALEEFHYELLTASTRYTPDGELQVSLHLEGRSPKLETNRPVHLNITTEQNVLSLLQSLRYSKGLTDEIDKEVQKQYQNSAP